MNVVNSRTTKHRILLVVPTIGVVGGIERWLIEMLDIWSEQSVFVLYSYRVQPERELPNLAKAPMYLEETFTTAKIAKIKKIISRARHIYRYVRDNDIDTVVVSADGLIIATLLTKLFLRPLRVIVVIHQELKTLPRFSRYLLSWLLPLSDQVVAVSAGIATEVAVAAKSAPVTIIPNSLNLEKVKQLAVVTSPYSTSSQVEFVAIGRFDTVKQFDQIIIALSALTDKVWHLTFIGDGPERQKLELLTKKYQLTDRITFIGRVDNVYPYLAVADALLVTSAYESFGLVLLEALALGVPIISYDCPVGPREIMANTEPIDKDFIRTPYGYLVTPNQPVSLQLAIEDFFSQPTFSADVLLARANDFDTAVVAQQWNAVLSHVI